MTNDDHIIEFIGFPGSYQDMPFICLSILVYTRIFIYKTWEKK